MTVNTQVIRILLRATTTSFVEIQDGLRIQVLPSFSYLPTCQKHHFAAFIADTAILVVWDDEPQQILDRVERLESALMKTIWGNESAYPEEEDEKKGANSLVSQLEGDPESMEEKSRRIVLMQPWLTAFTLFLSLAAIAAGYSQIAVEIFIDKNYIRLLFVLAIIPQFWLSLVCCSIILST
jgi:hypothetical protein